MVERFGKRLPSPSMVSINRWRRQINNGLIFDGFYSGEIQRLTASATQRPH
jgi:hypothetical protein